MNDNVGFGKEKLVVEVVEAHNLMPKDGEGSSSPFVEVEFENQRQRTQVKYKDLNPVWNDKLVFHVKDVADLPYRTIEINVFNERRSGNSRNFLGKVRVSGTNIAKEGEEGVQRCTLDKRSLFSHIKGEISFKLYLTTRADVKDLGGNNGIVSSVSSSSASTTSGFSKKNKKLHGPNSVMATQPQMVQENKPAHQLQNFSKALEQNLTENKPIVITTGLGPSIPTGASPAVGLASGVGGVGGAVTGLFSNRSFEFSLKETRPQLGGESLKDKTSSTYDLVEQMQYLYVKILRARDISLFGGGELVAEVKLGNYRVLGNGPVHPWWIRPKSKREVKGMEGTVAF